MSPLPEHWLTCRLGDVVNYGATIKAEPDSIPGDAWVLELEDIEKDTSKLLNRISFTERRSKSVKNVFFEGDILYGKLRPYLNKIIRADRDGYCTTEIVPLTPPAGLDGDYLFYWLKTPEFVEYATSASHGLNMPRLGTKAGREAPFVLAPMREQKRVSGKLDAIFGDLVRCISHLDSIPPLLKRVREAILAVATQQPAPTSKIQKLDPSARWHKVPFEELLADKDKLSYGVLKPGDGGTTGVPMYRVVDIGDWGKRNATVPSMITTELAHEYGRTTIEAGDILLSVMATIGRGMVATDDMAGANVNRAIALIKPDRSKVDSHFLLFYLLSPHVVREFESRAIGSAQRRINLGELRTFTVPLPPLIEQQEIVRDVTALFNDADRIERRYATVRRWVDRLSAAVLTKAFTGEFVSPVVGDEPAHVLIEQIRTDLATRASRISELSIQEYAPEALLGDQSLKGRMAPLTKEFVQSRMRELAADGFTFDQLRSELPGDYELLRELVFAVLSDSNSGIKQVFDSAAGSMRFERTNS